VIAAAAKTVTYLSCQKEQVEAYYSHEGVEIAIPVTVDIAQCLQSKVVTAKVELIRQIENVKISAQSIEQINSQLKNRTQLRVTSSDSEQVLASKNLDLSRLVPNSLARNRDFSSLTLAEIRALFPPVTVIAFSSNEVATVAGEGITTQQSDSGTVMLGKDPGSQKRGSLPLDTVASLRSSSPVGEYAISPLPVGAPSTKLVLGDSSRTVVRVILPYKGDKNSLVGSKIRFIVRANGVEAQVITLRPQLSDLLSKSAVPILPPDIIGSITAAGTIRVSITQRDERADTIFVTARSAKDYDQPTSGFITVGDNIACKKDQTASLSLNLAGKWVIRAHAVSGGKVSPVFKSVVVGSNPGQRERSSAGTLTSLIAVNAADGISLDFNTADPKAAYVLIRRIDVRSRTTSAVSQPIAISAAAGFIDPGVEDLAVVRYEADLYRSNGDVLRNCAQSEVITRIEPRAIVGAQITTTPVTVGNQTVQITIVPEVKQNDVNFLISYIKSLGLEASFQSDLESLRKSLLNCVKFDVTRFDLQTGESKYVGQTSDSIVDDIDDVKVTSRFLYLFEAFARSPSQVTDVITDRSNRPTGISPKVTRLGLHITKSDVDKINTTQSQLTDARRFFSRSNFETGTMPSQPAKDGFEDGRTGDVFLSRVTVRPTMPSVSNVRAKKIAGSPTITWEVSGDIKMVDRFVVTGNSSGATWTVGNASCLGSAASLQLTDTNKYALPRYVTYSVYPVFLSGKQGEPASAAAVFLEDLREV